jgi:pimeloyl-ACP methyl ester carboxylesterase
MRNAVRPAGKMAHTLVYESMILQSLPAERITSVRVPTLVIDGEQSHELIRQTAQSLAEALPDGRYRTLQGQGHDLVPAVLGPVVVEFLAG